MVQSGIRLDAQSTGTRVSGQPEGATVATYVLKRLGLALITLWLLSVIVFFASQVLPGAAATRWHRLLNESLSQLCLQHPERFAGTMTEKLMTYALGRGLEYYDKCAVDKIVQALDKNDYRFSVLLAEVVKSEPFQQRTATGSKP